VAVLAELVDEFRPDQAASANDNDLHLVPFPCWSVEGEEPVGLGQAARGVFRADDADVDLLHEKR
jgi:hypothetical protein